MDVLHLSLRQLQIFCAIAQSGSTAQAAKLIALSQSATSAALNELERLLGIQLFERTGKRLLLNENGRALLPKALALLSDAKQIEKISNSSSRQAQSLRIGASTTIGNYVLPKFLGDFLNQYISQENIFWNSKVMIGNTEKISAAVAAFELDIGLIEGPCHEADLLTTPWIQDELLIIAPRAIANSFFKNSLKRSQTVSLASLREQLWLIREIGSGTRESIDNLLLPHIGSYNFSIELGSSEAIRNAVESGLGISCLSRWVVQEALDSERIIQLKTDLPAHNRQSYIITHRDREPSNILNLFLEVLMNPLVHKPPSLTKIK